MAHHVKDTLAVLSRENNTLVLWIKTIERSSRTRHILSGIKGIDSPVPKGVDFLGGVGPPASQVSRAFFYVQE